MLSSAPPASSILSITPSAKYDLTVSEWRAMAMTGNCWKTHGLATHAAQLAAKYSLSCVQCTINNTYKFAQMQKCTFQRKEGANCKDWGKDKTVARQVRSCNWAKESHQDQNAFAAPKYFRRNIVRWHRKNLLSKLFFELDATAVCSIFVCLCFLRISIEQSKHLFAHTATAAYPTWTGAVALNLENEIWLLRHFYLFWKTRTAEHKSWLNSNEFPVRYQARTRPLYLLWVKATIGLVDWKWFKIIPFYGTYHTISFPHWEVIFVPDWFKQNVSIVVATDWWYKYTNTKRTKIHKFIARLILKNKLYPQLWQQEDDWWVGREMFHK